MPKVTEAYLEERREHILDAAIACVSRKGFHKTTMEDIGQEACVSPTVAYRYFDSKDDILVDTVRRSVDRSTRFFDEVAHEEDTFSIFEQMIDSHFERLELPGRQDYYRFRVHLWGEAIQNPRVADRLMSIKEEAQEQLAALIEKGQERGHIQADLDARTVAITFMSWFDGFALHWLADPEVDVGGCRDAFMAMVRGLFIHQG